MSVGREIKGDGIPDIREQDVYKRQEFKIVKGIVTNFHQPKSTLLLLISAFVKGNWKSIYEYALEHDFRFLSYGDSSLLL